MDSERLSFRTLLPTLPGIVDLILYMAQQYPWYFIRCVGL